jgi:hypothetical protein
VLRLRAPLRSVEAFTVEKGQRLSKDAISRHCKFCVGPERQPVPSKPAAPPDQLVALAAADVLVKWPSLTRQLAERLQRDGLPELAVIVSVHLDEGYRAAIDSANGTQVADLFSAFALARACGHTLRTRAPKVSAAIAADLRVLGADELAADMDWLAAQATEHATDDTPEETPCPPTT